MLWSNGGSSLVNVPGSNITARYSLFESAITGYSGTNNLITNTSPFANTATTQLSPCSPAVNAGDPLSTTLTCGTTDVAGNIRFYNRGRIDLGAYEYQGVPNSPVIITTQPISSTSVFAGATVRALVSVTGTVSSYQWYKDGLPVNGQTSAALSLSNVQTGDAGSYRVIIVSPCASVSSTVFRLSVQPVADLTPIVYARPTTLTGSQPVSVVVEVLELSGTATSGPITLKITRDPSLLLSLPVSATSVGGERF